MAAPYLQSAGAIFAAWRRGVLFAVSSLIDADADVVELVVSGTAKRRSFVCVTVEALFGCSPVIIRMKCLSGVMVSGRTGLHGFHRRQDGAAGGVHRVGRCCGGAARFCDHRHGLLHLLHLEWHRLLHRPQMPKAQLIWYQSPRQYRCHGHPVLLTVFTYCLCRYLAR